MNDLLKRLSSRKVILPALVVVVVCTVFLMKIEQQVVSNPDWGFLKMQLSFSRFEFFSVVKTWGSNGLKLYLNTLWLDYIYAVAYTILLLGGIEHFKNMLLKYEPQQQPAVQKKDYFALLPLLAGIADFIENSLHLFIFKLQYTGWVSAAIVISVIKWGALTISLLLFLKYYFSFRKLMRQALIDKRTP